MDPCVRNVFVNCPFDRKFRPHFDAIVFAIVDCGYRPRCARELDDGSETRIEKIFGIVEKCKFGIHDLSRTALDRTTRLPRFNMPLERKCSPWPVGLSSLVCAVAGEQTAGSGAGETAG